MTNARPLETPRPIYHFTAPRGWLNDPNGLVYHDGEYHLFYQHNPEADDWGPMSWGHAVSRDLVTWEHLPIALRPDELGAIFSGSAVVDHQDTAGFGPGAMVAIFTQDSADGQVQSLATSHDHGRTWVPFVGNPVLVHPDGHRNFRDPKVFWYGGRPHAGHWVMALAVDEEVWLYRSDDLRSWTHTDRYASPGRNEGWLVETADLFELPVDRRADDTRWVLTFGVTFRSTRETATWYVVGSFDGERFVPDEPGRPPRQADHGPDFYAAQSWNDHPTGRRVWIAWASNWAYANDTPTVGWRGSMSIPRELSLVTCDDGLMLSQCPIEALATKRRPLLALEGAALTAGRELPDIATIRTATLDLEMVVDVAASDAERVAVQLLAGPEEATTLTYDFDQGTLSLDRSRHGAVVGAGAFLEPSTVDVPARTGLLDLRILVDRYTVEVFAAGGTACLTAQIFPRGDSVGTAVSCDGGAVAFRSLRAYAVDTSLG